EYARLAGRPVIDHCQDPQLSEGGVMNEGPVATRLGLPGTPAAAEDAHIARDLQLAALTGGWIHLAHLSTVGGVALVREAKRLGVRVTAEAAPHHLTLTDEWVLGSSKFRPAYAGTPPSSVRSDSGDPIGGRRPPELGTRNSDL